MITYNYVVFGIPLSDREFSQRNGANNFKAITHNSVELIEGNG
jgi:hypothetical protein